MKSLATGISSGPPRLCGFQHILTLIVLSLGAGCWEEIRYTPAPPPPATTDSAKLVGISKEAEAAEPADSEPLAPSESELRVDSAPNATLTPDQLFGDDPSPAPDDVVPRESPVAATPPPTLTDPGESTESSPTATPAERQLIWEAASKWSLAAAMAAKGLAADRYESVRDEAATAARELGVILPPLPTGAEHSDLEARVVEALGGNLAGELVAQIDEPFGPSAAALANLAIRSNLLLLTYSPRHADVESLAGGVRAAAEASALPAEAWTPLGDLLQRRAEFLEVRSAVFELHRQAAKRLATP